MAFAKRRRQFLEILVARHLNYSATGRQHKAIGYPEARKYSEMVGEFQLALERVLRDYDGINYEEFETIRKRRHEYHTTESKRASKQGMEFLYEKEKGFQKTKMLHRDEMANDLLRDSLDWALHETLVKQYKEDLDKSPPLKVPILSETVLRSLETYLLEIADHEAYLDALAHVEHYLKGYDVFDVMPKKKLETMGELADHLRELYPNKSRKQLKDIAVDQYELTSMPHYRRNERAYRKALDSALARREKNAKKKS